MTDIETTKQSTPAMAESGHRWDPFSELESWLERMSPRRRMWPTTWTPFEGTDFTPLVDIEESDTAWTLEAELPGVEKQDIAVELHGRSVVIAGERKEKERTGVVRQRRRTTGTFRYEVTLPGDFDADAIEARLEHGELRVTVPKANADQARKIEIT